MTVTFFLHRIGPYHHARFQAAVRYVDFIAVETKPLSDEYPWVFTASGSYRIERLNTAASLQQAVERILETYQPDVVVTTGWADPEYHIAVLEAKKRSISCVVISDSRIDDEPRRFYKEWIKRLVLQSFSSALVAGTMSRAYMIRLGFSPDAIFQPWDVVDNAYFTSQQSDYDFNARYFFCVARFIREKNLLKLIEAYASYRRQGGERKLVLAGSGEMEESIREAIRYNQVESTVNLVGFIQYNQLPAYYGGAFALILPSVKDTWGLAVNEAMASGLPVLVSSHCGCSADIVRHGINGFVFDPYDTQAIAKSMLELDQMNEGKWEQFRKESIRLIDEWDVDDFASGLHRACGYAVNNEASRRGFSFVHQLLSFKK